MAWKWWYLRPWCNSKITRITNEDEIIVGSSNVCDQCNILSDLLGNGDDLRPAPLQNTTIPTDTFEVIIDVLNTSTNGIDDANCAINELQDIATALENYSINDDSGNQFIPPYVMNQNQTTTTLQQYDVVSRRGGFFDMAKSQYVWARAFPTIFILFFTLESGLYTMIYLDIMRSEITMCHLIAG